MVILVAGLTPAWQRMLTFHGLRPGEVNRADDVHESASGKVLNVGAAVHQLGADSLTISPAGGPTGLRLREDFARLGVPTTWIETRHPTRVCTTLLDRTGGHSTELVEPSPALSPAELRSWLAAYRDAAARAELVVLTGSLPRDTPVDFYAELLASTRVPVLLDVRGPELRACLSHRPWLVKPNREELAMTVGRPLPNDDAVCAAMRELQDAGAGHVVVSEGARGLFAAGPHGLERHPAPPVTVVNPIGCGDCLAAGLAVARYRGRAWSEGLALGLETAARNAATLLPARFATVPDGPESGA